MAFAGERIGSAEWLAMAVIVLAVVWISLPDGRPESRSQNPWRRISCKLRTYTASPQPWPRANTTSCRYTAYTVRMAPPTSDKCQNATGTTLRPSRSLTHHCQMKRPANKA